MDYFLFNSVAGIFGLQEPYMNTLWYCTVLAVVSTGYSRVWRRVRRSCRAASGSWVSKGFGSSGRLAAPSRSLPQPSRLHFLVRGRLSGALSSGRHVTPRKEPTARAIYNGGSGPLQSVSLSSFRHSLSLSPSLSSLSKGSAASSRQAPPATEGHIQTKRHNFCFR